MIGVAIEQESVLVASWRVVVVVVVIFYLHGRDITHTQTAVEHLFCKSFDFRSFYM
jgi:hypothetical protein